ncbi:MAG: hypothetical protein E7215_16800 [Clostridium sulfidigenes]|uniref:Uncharacterized protein n=1 Tax=Clostridium sulfidigenes TaxID=318464 RepID=A0A927WBG3_9CLOT|nr:hypothetical protein [Clostridium sulfidigenes]
MILSLMSQDYIESYLDMIEKYESADYGVGMGDFNDIKTVTKESLIKYIKISLNSYDEDESIEKLKKRFKFLILLLKPFHVKNMN